MGKHKNDLPPIIFVKREHDKETSYLSASDDLDSMVEMGEKIDIGRYELVQVNPVEGVAFNYLPTVIRDPITGVGTVKVTKKHKIP